MRRSKTLRPGVEELEAILSLSGLPMSAGAAASAGAAGELARTAWMEQHQQQVLAHQQQLRLRQAGQLGASESGPIDLSGTIRGTYTLELSADGSSGTMLMRGAGPVRGLGGARLTGGYAASASSSPETMDLTLSNGRGDVNLRVGRSATDTDPSRDTARLRYQVVSGTGMYAGATGSGIFDMTVRPTLRSLGATGQLSIALHPDPA